MKTKIFFFFTVLCFTGCNDKMLAYESGDLLIIIEPGDSWIHEFNSFVDNSPQFAVWLTDVDGNYLTTLFVTRKIATEGWIFNKGNRRKEALPFWSYSRGVQYSDGLFLPTKKSPLTDGVTGATPKGRFELKVRPKDLPDQYIIYVEINHSTDFNEAFPKDAVKGDFHYSGGEEGSGQPALVYSAMIDQNSAQVVYDLTLVGYSQPDGSSGALYSDISDITTALDIVKEIKVELVP